jgi:two-component system response regulator PilR (NtrC family)
MKEDVKVMVVDDEAIMRNLLLKILEQEGYRVTLVSSAKEAVEKLNNEKFELVLSDVKMPDMDGFQLLKKIKEEWPQTAIIMMTGYGDAYTVKEALMLGADEYITKPFKSHEISLIIERAYWRLLATKRRINEESKVAD